MFDTDVFVLGGGPAGLAVAIASRRAGMRVVLADAECPPIDKTCGEGLMPASLSAVANLGIAIPNEAGAAFRGIRFYGGENIVESDFPDGKGLGVRRTVLQQLLVAYAEQVGVQLLWRTPVTGLKNNKVQLGRRELKARWIAGADGLQSSVRRWTGFPAFNQTSQRFSFRRHYRVAAWSEYVEIHWGDGCQFYVTPVRRDEICLVLMTRNPHLRICNALEQFPMLHRRLAGHEAVSSESGSLAATRHVRSVTRGNVALIGDASGTVDPITGEGLYLAFRQAVSLAEAYSTDDLTKYERTHARISGRPRFIGDFMLLMDRYPVLRRRTLRAFETNPRLFRNLLALHVGGLGLPRFLATAASLGWRVVTP
jgi:flavin-dependent dehydrogenase